jgi:chorismate mutase
MELELEPLKLPSDNERPFVIAGPCSAETEEQVMTTAHQLKDKGCHMFRAGVWKPRTKPGGFEGNGEMALPWMKRVKDETGMLVAVEVAKPEHVELCMKYDIDILWIGARTSANPFAMQDVADSLKGTDVPVFIKNPVNPDLELWIGALERINQAGIKRLAAIHRGFSSYDKKIYRNLPMWQIPMELHRRIPNLPIICDPSHIGGRRELVAPLCQQAMDLGFDGLIVESHCSPDEAWSDARQQVTPDVLDYILSLLVVREESSTTEGIQVLRHQIDEFDNQLLELLAKRMRVCREIGQYKKEHNMTFFMPTAITRFWRNAAQPASAASTPSVRPHLELIHQETCATDRDHQPVGHDPTAKKHIYK